MPMDRSLYPPDWEEIALAKKNAANWTCEHCGRPCREPGVDWMDFVMDLLNGGGPTGWYADTYEEAADGSYIEKPQRFTLTVAHLDQNPQNNAPENLKALCAPCHLNHDRPFRLHNSYRKKERRGQLNLLTTNVHPVPAGHGRAPKAVQHPIFPQSGEA